MTADQWTTFGDVMYIAVGIVLLNVSTWLERRKARKSAEARLRSRASWEYERGFQDGLRAAKDGRP